MFGPVLRAEAKFYLFVLRKLLRGRANSGFRVVLRRKLPQNSASNPTQSKDGWALLLRECYPM
jgi:hypothetical protein